MLIDISGYLTSVALNHGMACPGFLDEKYSWRQVGNRRYYEGKTITRLSNGWHFSFQV